MASTAVRHVLAFSRLRPVLHLFLRNAKFRGIASYALQTELRAAMRSAIPAQSNAGVSGAGKAGN